MQVDSDTVWNEMHSSSAVRMAVGCLLELAFKVASGELKVRAAVALGPGAGMQQSQPSLLGSVLCILSPGGQGKVGTALDCQSAGTKGAVDTGSVPSTWGAWGRNHNSALISKRLSDPHPISHLASVPFVPTS